MNRVRGSQNNAASWSESQSYEPMPCNFQSRAALRCDFHNAAPARKRRRNVQIAVDVESQALRASQAAEELMNRALRIDSVNTVKTRT